MDNCQTNFKSVAHKATAFLNWDEKPASSRIESLSCKALEIFKKNLIAGISTRADAINELMRSGLASNSIQANEVLRYLEDNQKIFPVEDSGLLKVITNRNISNFDRHQRQLQDQWLHAKGFNSSISITEQRENAATEILRKEPILLRKRGYSQKKKQQRQQSTKEQEPQQQIQEVYFLK